MASGSGDGPRRSILMKGKDRMLDNVDYDNTAYHEFLQHQAYAESLNSPRPPLIISEPDPNTTPHLTSQSKNMHDPLQILNLNHLLKRSYRSIPNLISSYSIWRKLQADGSTIVVCNYCKKVFKWSKFGGYGSLSEAYNKHPSRRTCQIEFTSQNFQVRYP